MAKKAKKKTAVKKKSTKTAKAKSSGIQLGNQFYAFEKDVLFRPDRMKYVRKLIKSDQCVFCLAAKNGVGLEVLCVHETEHSMIVMNKFPYNSGHLLVLPKRHQGEIAKLPVDEFTDLTQTLRQAMIAVEKVYQPGGINMGLNQGAVAGAGIPDHLHFHVIPRWAGDINFFPLIAESKVVVESLEVGFERLLTYFKAL